MRKASLKKNHRELDAAIARYRAFMDRILPAQRVISAAQEKRDIAESVLLRLCAHWESFVEAHLVDCVNVDHSKLNEYFSLTIPSNPSRDLCHALVLGSGYKDFRSMGELKGFSKSILPDPSNPFLAISNKNAERIDDVYKIRNYLARYSSAARRSLTITYRKRYNMRKFLEPGYFVLAYGAWRLREYFDAFEGASAEMKATY